jgi:hypothetical protein
MFYRMRTQTYGTINGMSLEFSLTSINMRNYTTLRLDILAFQFLDFKRT